MKYYMLSFDDNWADEFDVSGFSVATEEEWECFQNNPLPEWRSWSNLEMYFGTNESITYNSREEYFSCINLEEITEEEFLTLKKLFNVGITEYEEDFGKYYYLEAYGTFPNPFDC